MWQNHGAFSRKVPQLSFLKKARTKKTDNSLKKEEIEIKFPYWDWILSAWDLLSHLLTLFKKILIKHLQPVWKISLRGICGIILKTLVFMTNTDPDSRYITIPELIYNEKKKNYTSPPPLMFNSFIRWNCSTKKPNTLRKSTYFTVQNN